MRPSFPPGGGRGLLLRAGFCPARRQLRGSGTGPPSGACRSAGHKPPQMVSRKRAHCWVQAQAACFLEMFLNRWGLRRRCSCCPFSDPRRALGSVGLPSSTLGGRRGVAGLQESDLQAPHRPDHSPDTAREPWMRSILRTVTRGGAPHMSIRSYPFGARS